MTYVVLMRPDNVPLGLGFRTIKECLDEIRAQVIGGYQRENYIIAKVENGGLVNTATGEKIIPEKSFYTNEAWNEFLDAVEGKDKIP